MKDRDCKTCVHAHPFGGWYDNNCDVWECEYINRKEAIEAYKARRDIDLVKCGECKWWDYSTSGCECIHPLAPFRDEDFCSYGERKE